tara:strand:+ start:1708 stop:2724 length:1017 start_codon:yes stop_codon:yes gene_type:complete
VITKRRVILLISLLTICFSGICQDMQFTQFNAAPLYLNPGFTGSTAEHRFVSNYRNQWTAIPGHFVGYTFAYDYNLSALNSGIGLLFAREQSGSGNLGNTEIGVLYSYHIKIDRKIFVQPALKINYVTRGVDFNKLVFNDQLARGGVSNSTTDDIELNTARYADFTAGLLVYTKEFWAGVSFNHINEPNQTLGDGDSPLYMKFSAHGGYKFNLSERGGRRVLNSTYINVVGHYKSQQKYDQLDLGMYYTRDPLVFGLWYRGVPLIKSQNNVINNDAVAIVLGYKLSDYNLNIGYSYDVTISRLSANSAGSHEVSIVYEVASKKKKRKRRKFFVPCAKF